MAGSPQEASTCLQRNGVGVVLADASTTAGIDAVRALSDAEPSAKVIALARFDDDVIACAEAGVSGFVVNEATLDDVVAAALAVARGEISCSPKVAAILLHRITATNRRHADTPRLTSREREILVLIDDGLSNKEIAGVLCIEVSTVKNHVHHILEKLGARRRAEAAARLRTGTLAHPSHPSPSRSFTVVSAR